MKLDRHTYEAWLLDRLEGVLTPDQEAALDAFLLENPDLLASSDPLPRVHTGTEPFPGKENLHRTFPPTGSPDAARLDDFLVARMEQELTSKQQQQLEQYLFEHPEAEQHAALMALAKAPNDPLAFSEKEKLQRHFPPHGLPDVHRLTDFLIADLEGDLTAVQQKALQAYLAGNADARREQELVNATRVKSELLPYPAKADLKKREVRVFSLWARLAVAASVMLLLGAGWWILREGSVKDSGIAKVETQQVMPGPSSVGSTNKASVEDNSTSPIHHEATRTAQPAEENDGVQRKEVSTSGKVKSGESKTLDPLYKIEQEQEPEAPPQVPSSPMPTMDRLPVKEPTLAQLPVQPSKPMGATSSVTTPVAANGNEEMAMVDTRSAGQSLGTFVANAVRGEVLAAPKRADKLDGDDALALADKAVGAVTGGRGGVELKRTADGERIKLRIGRNLSFSASTGR